MDFDMTLAVDDVQLHGGVMTVGKRDAEAMLSQRSGFLRSQPKCAYGTIVRR